MTLHGHPGRMRESSDRDAMGCGATGMTLRSDLVFFPLDDGLVVFSESLQSLVGLNATAAFIARKLEQDIAVPELAKALISEQGAAPEDAEKWVNDAIRAFASQGLLAQSPAPARVEAPAGEERGARQKAAMPPYAPFTPVAEAHYRLLKTCALIRYAHPAQMRMVDLVIGHLKTDETVAPDLVIDISGVLWEEGTQLTSYVYRDGKPEGQANRLSHVGPIVKSVLWMASVNAHDFLLDLHAGVVGKGDRCILLPAEAGSGKSSLTAALVHSGLDYYSDEVALVERDSFLVPPVPLAVCVKSTGWDLMARYYPEIAQLPSHRRGDKKVVRYVPPPRTALARKPGHVSHIFFPCYAKDQPTQLTRLARSDALARLMDQCLAFRMRLDSASVQELVRWIAGIDCFALPFSSLDDAVELVRGTAFR